MPTSLTSVAAFVDAFYRQVGTTTDDDALTEQGESADDVAYHWLTYGTWAAQRYLIANGMGQRWLKRSSAISWSGTEASDGGQYWALPSDFLRAAGGDERSPLVEANGDMWGTEVLLDQRHRTGNLFYFADDELWKTRGADPPTTLYLEYFERHTAFTSGLASIDFPLDARPLIPAEAAALALGEAWCPLDAEGKQAVRDHLKATRVLAKDVARQSRTPRRMRAGSVYGRHWFT